ncbi:TPA: type I toxin-antitoxin system Ibs family toxin [Escherichia coli]|uniref:Type I toxin-antitoxin system Ibs family toxin n=1 Tax=Escherichia coli TaxID=562 RepID=A0A6D0MZJ4_ECOLX|nr:type I toxin-antitoxin system Ibs family toxin [Escherichia coli]EFO2122401.1 type I toxin-antitoxin system Ibs family toxin [Escherichia coli O106]EFA4733457.1 type I toxin-antitoxin system Ibs family toxin [Escherichia coli]EFN4306945.1 type I toxin-antitoxin system Ibs family toxin [Escherichia coli]EFN7656751.1 type I toxin-antitoxin system Ibs family toxin [Escherichia coli]EGI6695046.1 type I toxin-antitoxin system Ibs family toxin [Escherichia coli]
MMKLLIIVVLLVISFLAY